MSAMLRPIRGHAMQTTRRCLMVLATVMPPPMEVKKCHPMHVQCVYISGRTSQDEIQTPVTHSPLVVSYQMAPSKIATVDYTALVHSMKQCTNEPDTRQLKLYLQSIGSSPCAITMEAAVSFHVEMHKLQRVGHCLKVLNRRISEAQEYESEEGAANLPRVQRKYLLKSMEVGLRRSQRNHTYLLSAVRDQVSPARGTPDPHFYKLLLQWYTDKAQNVADNLCEQWVDTTVQYLESVGLEGERAEVQLTKTKSPVMESQTVELKRVSTRSPPVFSDDESGSDKAPSGDEFGTDED